ncbi:unnamed protein product [Pylaiella littoralis]
MRDERLRQVALLGDWTGGGARYPGGQEFDWLKRLQEDLEAFGIIIDNKKGWEATAERVDEWDGKIDENVGRLMHEWFKRRGEFKETRRLKRERDAPEGQALAKRGRMDSGDEREEGCGRPKGQQGCSGVHVARQREQPKAKLRCGRIGKPVGQKSRSGVAAAPQLLCTVVAVTGGMRVRMRRASVNRQTSCEASLRLMACFLFIFPFPISHVSLCSQCLSLILFSASALLTLPRSLSPFLPPFSYPRLSSPLFPGLLLLTLFSFFVVLSDCNNICWAPRSGLHWFCLGYVLWLVG